MIDFTDSPKSLFLAKRFIFLLSNQSEQIITIIIIIIILIAYSLLSLFFKFICRVFEVCKKCSTVCYKTSRSIHTTMSPCSGRLRLRKYVRIVCLIMGIYAFRLFIVAFKQNVLVRNWPTTVTDNVSTKMQNYSETFVQVVNIPEKRQYANNITTTDDSPVTDHSNISYQVIYSENEMQLLLKSIHEHGARAINLKPGRCEQRLPQCLIIGNYKSGTQELLEFMFMHPRIRIYREPLFELNFFAGNYNKGLQWYRKQMPCSYDKQITVEKSACYFQEPESPGRIHAMNSSVKLIVLVREPISRALAHFSFSQHIAKRYQNKFDHCAINSTSGDINRDCFAIKHSIYDEGMERYLKHFHRSQIKLLDADEFKRNPFKLLQDIETFLNLEHVIKQEHFVFIKEKGFHCVRSINNKLKVVCYDHRRGRKDGTSIANTVSNTTLYKLQAFFKEHNGRFFQQIDQTFKWQYNWDLIIGLNLKLQWRGIDTLSGGVGGGGGGGARG